MHYLDYLAAKLSEETDNQSHFLNFANSGRGGSLRPRSESIRLVLEEEVAAGRLRYNALSCNLDAAGQEQDSPCFPGWTGNQS